MQAGIPRRCPHHELIGALGGARDSKMPRILAMNSWARPRGCQRIRDSPGPQHQLVGAPKGAGHLYHELVDPLRGASESRVRFGGGSGGIPWAKVGFCVISLLLQVFILSNKLTNIL